MKQGIVNALKALTKVLLSIYHLSERRDEYCWKLRLNYWLFTKHGALKLGKSQVAIERVNKQSTANLRPRRLSDPSREKKVLGFVETGVLSTIRDVFIRFFAKLCYIQARRRVLESTMQTCLIY